MKQLFLFLILIGITPNVFGNDNVFQNLSNEVVFKEIIKPQEMKVKHYFGIDKKDNPIIVSDEYLTNQSKTKGYVNGMIDSIIKYGNLTSEEKNCVSNIEEILLGNFKNDTLSGEKLIIDEVNISISKCIE